MIYLCIVLYALGVRLMIDNIRAQPHAAHPRGYGFALLAITIGRPIAVAADLVADKVHALTRKPP